MGINLKSGKMIVVPTSPRATSDEWKLVAQLVASGWVTHGGVCEEPAEEHLDQWERL
ncbi:hypothetical protein FOIG_04801 [Fusarium odoratissimum NRRL 54006]|uniref:Uncharacterized protein n=2 Tax=Fusarium oxysporum species complex TaxID=171631 RepID=X0K7J4_FUSO5|nr:uncharacterized protein FOIG_04801 [Fusarium odoratissimum NRRL 54006]EXM04606.1 hypothetical protein FOIG_04801 [Fusarium odoratissimum NRRL 54006]TXB98339.1 hypothetical protein FocTR4_00012516 [Fusarium oxysporum f. sp. cubense]